MLRWCSGDVDKEGQRRWVETSRHQPRSHRRSHQRFLSIMQRLHHSKLAWPGDRRNLPSRWPARPILEAARLNYPPLSLHSGTMSSIRVTSKRLLRILPKSSIRSFSSRHTSLYAPRHLLSIADLSHAELSTLVSISFSFQSLTFQSFTATTTTASHSLSPSRSAMQALISKHSNPALSRCHFIMPSPAVQLL